MEQPILPVTEERKLAIELCRGSGLVGWSRRVSPTIFAVRGDAERAVLYFTAATNVGTTQTVGLFSNQFSC